MLIMSKQIEIQFSYSKNEDVSAPVFPQDLLERIDTRVSYAASLDIDSNPISDRPIDSHIIEKLSRR